MGSEDIAEKSVMSSKNLAQIDYFNNINSIDYTSLL